jgi:site-specific recombinase XerD
VAARCPCWGALTIPQGGKARAILIEGGLEEVLGAYLATRRARFEHHDLDHPATPLFVDVRGRRLAVHQVKYLIERLYVRVGVACVGLGG